MDLVTHSMTGLLIGSVAATRKDKLYAVLLTGAFASALPDLDAVLYFVDTNLYQAYHRVFTHTLAGAPFLAIPGAIPAWLWVRGRYLRLYLIALACIMIHLGMDVLCDWELYLLFPFSRKDFAQGYIEYSSPPLLIVITIITIGILFMRQKREAKLAKDEP
jgi:membrane-bound metal-dependent hydrolase YbcI (DUF457 family)